MLSRQSVLFAFVFLLTMPGLAHAKDMQADQQCKAGGTVGQPCKDMTNGYVTSGHCTHINICKADSWNTSPPKGCGSSGNINAPTADCPKAPPISPGTNPTRPVSNTAPISIDPVSPINSTIFDQAFSDISDAEYVSNDTVSTTTLNGIEYFISGGEALPAGAPLTEAPPEITPPPRTTLSLGTAYGLSPSKPQTDVSGEGGEVKSYTPAIGTFTSNGSRDDARSFDFAGQIVRLGGQVTGAISEALGNIFIGENQAFKNEVEQETIPLSLYAQVNWRPTTFSHETKEAQSERIFDRIIVTLRAVTAYMSAHLFPSFPR